MHIQVFTATLFNLKYGKMRGLEAKLTLFIEQKHHLNSCDGNKGCRYKPQPAEQQSKDMSSR